MKRIPLLRRFDPREAPLGFLEYDPERLTDLELLGSVIAFGGRILEQEQIEGELPGNTMCRRILAFEITSCSVQSDEDYLRYLQENPK